MVIMEVLSTVDNVGMRNMLLVLVLIAVVLLITGAVIALMTFYDLRKTMTARSVNARSENKKF